MNVKKIYFNIIKFIFNKKLRFVYLGNRGLLGKMADDKYLKQMYKYHTNRELNLDDPVLYTEKLQWLKLHDRNPEYTKMVDKYEVKKYVAERIGSQYVIPNLGVWSKFDEIDFNQLPNEFVLKCTHDSGSVVVCKDKKSFNIIEARKKINRYMKRKYYLCNREWPYKNVKPRIIAEKYMEDKEDQELRDYKFFTFNGIPRVLYITQGRGSDIETTADFFDMDFKHLPFTIDHEMSQEMPHPPKQFELMKELACKLSNGTPQLRVDFYEVNGNVYFGEMTFFHCSGFANFHPYEWDRKLGDLVILPEKKYENNKNQK